VFVIVYLCCATYIWRVPYVPVSTIEQFLMATSCATSLASYNTCRFSSYSGTDDNVFFGKTMTPGRIQLQHISANNAAVLFVHDATNMYPRYAPLTRTNVRGVVGVVEDNVLAELCFPHCRASRLIIMYRHRLFCTTSLVVAVYTVMGSGIFMHVCVV